MSKWTRLWQVRRCWWVVTLMAMLVDMGGFGEVHRGFGIGQINDGGIMLLDWAVGKGLSLINTCFQKRKCWLIAFRSGETETVIDYILVNSK